MKQFNLAGSLKIDRGLAFHYANYNWFLAGSFLSRTGDWFDRVAINWFVFSLTNSPFYLGLVELCRLLPILFFSVFGGVLADKWDRRKVLIITHLGAMLTTFAMAAVIFRGMDNFGSLALVILVRGIFLAFEIPARNALIPNLVPQQAMMSAVSFFSATYNTARVLGPALAGFLLVRWSVPALIMVNAVSFLAVIGTLLMIRPVHEQKEMDKQLKFVEGIGEALQYLKNNSMVMGIFILGIVPMVFGYPYTTLMPVFAKELLQVGPEGFGMLLSFSAAGSVIGSLVLGWGRYPAPKGWLYFWCICGFGAGIIFFSFSKFFALSLLLMIFVGLASQGYRILERVIIQETIPDHLRGRILSIVMMDNGLVPLGDVLIGFLGQSIGAVAALRLMGSVCVVTALAVILRDRSILKIR